MDLTNINEGRQLYHNLITEHSSGELSSCCSCRAAQGIAGGSFWSSYSSEREKEDLCCACRAQLCEPQGLLGSSSTSVKNSCGPSWGRATSYIQSASVMQLVYSLGSGTLLCGTGCSYLPRAGMGDHWFLNLLQKEFVSRYSQQKLFV